MSSKVCDTFTNIEGSLSQQLFLYKCEIILNNFDEAAAYKTRFYFPHDANELTDCECTFLAGAPAREGAFGLWGADRCGDCWLQKRNLWKAR